MPRGFRIGYPKNTRLAAEIGAYQVTGRDAVLKRGRPPLVADGGSYAVTGRDATLSSTGSAAVGTLNTTFTVTHTGTQPFTFGQVFKKGDVPTGQSVRSNCPAYQVDVRNRWDDGSVRFAVISGVAPSGTYTLNTTAAAYSGSNVAEPTVAAVVSFTSVTDSTGAAVAGGSFSADIATARTNGALAWSRTTAHKVRQILGPVMSEFHYFVPTADAHTHVWFYVRAYVGGQIEVETVVENGWLLVSNPGRRDYRVTVTIGGTLRYDSVRKKCGPVYPPTARTDTSFTLGDTYASKFPVGTLLYLNGGSTIYTVTSATNFDTPARSVFEVSGGTVPNPLTSIELIGHHHHTRWSRVDWVDTAHGEAVPQHNVDYLQDTSQLAKLSTASLTESFFSSAPTVGTKYAAWTREMAERPAPGAHPPNVDTSMGSGGWSDFTNLLAPWETAYLASGDARAYWAMQGNSRMAGYFCTHYRDENTGAPVRGSERQQVGIRYHYEGVSEVSGNANTLTPAPSGFAPPFMYYVSHCPSFSYGAYLTSGRWSAMEEVQFIASIVDIEAHQGYLYNSQRIARKLQLRSWAWHMRAMAQAAICTPEYLMGAAPDAKTQGQRTEAINRWAANVEWNKRTYVDNDPISAPSNAKERTIANNPFGLWWIDGIYSATNFRTSGFMQNFAAAVVLWAYCTGALDSENLRQLARFAARYPVGALGAAPNGSSWDWRFTSIYNQDWGYYISGNSENGATLLASWNAVWAAINSYTDLGVEPNKLRKGEGYFGASHGAGTIKLGHIAQGPGSEIISFSPVIALAHQASKRTALDTGYDADLAAARYYGSDTWLESEANYFRSHYSSAFSYKSKDYSSLPYELPSAGQVVEIGTNTASAPVGGLPTGWSLDADWNYSLFQSFGGGAFVPTYSTHGAYVLAGTGGHDHACMTGAAVFDFTTATWERLPNANGSPEKSTNPKSMNQNTESNGAPYFERNDGSSFVPLPPHMYATLCYMPEGDKGSVIYVTRGGVGGGGVSAPSTTTSTASHRFDLDTRMWSRATTSQVPNSPTIVGEEADALWDEARNRWWYVPSWAINNLDRMYYLDRGDMTVKSTSASSGYFPGAMVTSGSRAMLHDTYLIVNSGSQGLWLYDPDDVGPGWIKLNVSPSDASLPSIRNRWARHSNGNWYAFSGDTASNVVTRIRPPADPKAGTWLIDTITLGSNLPARYMIGGTTAHYSRLFYVPSIDCIAWIPGGSQSVYLFKPGS